MDKKDLFGWLVNYHYSNLEECLPYIHEGVLSIERKKFDQGKITRKVKEQLIEGRENELYSGVLIVANGHTLADRLKDGKVITSELEDWSKINGEDDLANYLSEQNGNDGAYLLDSYNGRITHAAELNNNPDSLPGDLPIYEMIPDNFVYSDGSNSNLGKIGTKTRLAIKIPHAYEHTETYQIKRTAYTPLGLGKVTHFGTQGLIEEFFFRYNPAQSNIEGVYRRYERDEDNLLVRVEEKTIPYHSQLEDKVA